MIRIEARGCAVAIALATLLADSLSAQRPVAAGEVGMSPPDSIPVALYADSNLVTNSTRMTGTFLRNLVVVSFKAQATAERRTAAIRAVHGTVVGGYRFSGGDGFYLVKIQDDGTEGPLWSAIATLEVLPSVEFASPELLLEVGDGIEGRKGGAEKHDSVPR